MLQYVKVTQLREVIDPLDYAVHEIRKHRSDLMDAIYAAERDGDGRELERLARECRELEREFYALYCRASNTKDALDEGRV